VFLGRKKGLILLLFSAVVVGIFFAVKGAIIEQKPEIGTLKSARAIGNFRPGRPVEEMARPISGDTLKMAY